MKVYALETWVNNASDQSSLELRQAIHTVIHAISQSELLAETMIIKGGVLLAIKFNSTRFTKDIDFSTAEMYKEFDQNRFLEELNGSLALAVDSLPYDLDCRIQSYEINPKKGHSFPTLEVRIGFAYKGTPKHKRLLSSNSPSVLRLDFSFNEKTAVVDFIEIDEGTIKAYSLIDVVAEKYRAILQQKTRKRTRRQDAYDIFYLLSNGYLNSVDQHLLLETMRLKARERGLEIRQEDIFDSEVRARSEDEYLLLASEIEGELPEFGTVYSLISEFYASLPWD